ncbi:hypothetical protein [Haladaptatus sp. T7]|uniref:hypothetical protein n=1 Tax=Haladaptatus sp. T7 TaxID=2029368 RepID=UPI00223093D3|nr:hypothetical protein [Haladaptatus sp. T7]
MTLADDQPLHFSMASIPTRPRSPAQRQLTAERRCFTSVGSELINRIQIYEIDVSRQYRRYDSRQWKPRYATNTVGSSMAAGVPYQSAVSTVNSRARNASAIDSSGVSSWK